MMLIKALSGNEPYVTKGKLYEPLSSFGGKGLRYFFIKHDDGLVRSVHESHFEVVDEPKEETVKIKAKFDCNYDGYKSGDVFEATEYGGFYYFTANNGIDRIISADQFTLLPDEPAIEVGSVWVSKLKGHNDRELTVTATSQKMAILQWNDTGKEFAAPLSYFGNQYKPKPKTVTMYFYQSGRSIVAYDRESYAWGNLLFTREIELP